MSTRQHLYIQSERLQARSRAGRSSRTCYNTVLSSLLLEWNASSNNAVRTNNVHHSKPPSSPLLALHALERCRRRRHDRSLDAAFTTMRLDEPRHATVLAAKVLVEVLRLLERSRAQQPDHVLAAEHFLLQELLRDEADLVLLLGQQVFALLVRFVHDALHLDIDVLCRLLGEGLLDLVLLVVFVVDVTNLLRHAPLGHHHGGHLRDLAEVVRRTRSDGFEVEFLGDAAAQRHGHAVHQLVDVHEVRVAVGEVLCVSEGALAARDDGDLEERISPLEVPAADGVAGFVVSDGLLLFGLEYEGFLFETANDTLDGLFEVHHCYGIGSMTGS